MVTLSHHTKLDATTRAAVGAFVHAVAAERGYAPLGETKRLELDADTDGWSALIARDDEELVGYAHLSWNDQDTGPQTAVRPRVVVEALADGRARQALEVRLLREAVRVLADRGGGLLWSWAHHVTDQALPQVALGFRVQRRLAVMQRSLAGLREPDWPDEVVLKRFRPGHDESAFLRVNNAAFAGHPENGNWDEAKLAERLAVDGITPNDLLMAWRGDQLLGFHWTRVHPGAVGEVYVLAVDPSAQNTGLGRSLLRAGLLHLAKRGCQEAMLYVDRAQVAAAALYRSEGFTRRYDEVCYETEVLPSGSSL